MKKIKWMIFLSGVMLFTFCSVENPATGINTPTGSVCGNGTTESGEQCDDGNTSAGDGCSATCMTEVAGSICGNGTLESGEQCDDGNTIAGDGCSATCMTEVATQNPGTLTISATLTAATYANKAYTVHVIDSTGKYVAGLWSSNTVAADGTVNMVAKAADAGGCITDTALDATLPGGTYYVTVLFDTSGFNLTSKPSGCVNVGAKITNAEMGFRATVTINGNQTLSVTDATLAATVTETLTISGAAGSNVYCFVYDEMSLTAGYPGMSNDNLGIILGVGKLVTGAGSFTTSNTFISGAVYNFSCLAEATMDFAPNAGDAVGDFNGLTITGAGTTLSTWVIQ